MPLQLFLLAKQSMSMSIHTGAASVSLCSVNNEERDFIGTV